MKQKSIFIGVGVIIVLVIAWAVFRPETALVDKKVDESVPKMMNDNKTMMMDENMSMKQDNVMKEMILGKGMFQSGEHNTSGMATIYQLENGKKVLRLSNLNTSNGPDVHVLLVPKKNVMKNSDVMIDKAIDLGPIKGNMGNQNYDIPANVDIEMYHTVSIWCKRFSVNFGSAPIS
jgi:hypothetical protein